MNPVFRKDLSSTNYFALLGKICLILIILHLELLDWWNGVVKYDSIRSYVSPYPLPLSHIVSQIEDPSLLSNAPLVTSRFWQQILRQYCFYAMYLWWRQTSTQQKKPRSFGFLNCFFVFFVFVLFFYCFLNLVWFSCGNLLIF